MIPAIDQTLPLERIRNHSLYGTYRNIFVCAYGMPLFLYGRGITITDEGNPISSFCRTIHPPDGNCVTCGMRELPPLSQLEPWVCSAPCKAGLEMAAAPVRLGSVVFAWLVTGQVLVNGTGDEMLSSNGISADLHEQLRNSPTLSRDRYDQSLLFLDLMGQILGSEINSMILEEKRPGHSAQTTPSEAEEHRLRDRLEATRKIILGGHGTEEEIAKAAALEGWPGKQAFCNTFLAHYHESPREHYQRVQHLYSRLAAFQFQP